MHCLSRTPGKGPSPSCCALGVCTLLLTVSFFWESSVREAPLDGKDSRGAALCVVGADLAEPGVRSIVPIYPVTRLFADETDSWRRHAVGYGNDAELLEAFNAAYAGENVRDPLVSVDLASDEMVRGRPPCGGLLEQVRDKSIGRLAAVRADGTIFRSLCVYWPCLLNLWYNMPRYGRRRKQVVT